MEMKRRLVGFLAGTLVLAMLAGCSKSTEPSGSSTQQPQASPVSTEPVTLKMFQSSVNITDEQFQNLIAVPVNKKYPNITVELVRGTNAKAQEMLAAGDFPDLIFTGIGSVNFYRDLDLLSDLNGYVKKTNFNLADFESRIIDQIKVYGKNGELYAIPYSENFSALFYNKDLFNKYGASYPKDGMTWDEAITLAKAVGPRTGDEASPLCVGSFTQFASPLSLPLVDPKTNKALLETDQWRMALQMFYDIQKIPGNACKGDTAEVKAFQEGTIAMAASNGARLGEFEQLAKAGNVLNWDVATYPQFKEAPGKRRRMDIFLMMISSQTKYKEQAFQVIQAVSAKDEQLIRTKQGNLSPFKDPELKKNYVADFKSSAGKNIQGIFKTEPSALPPVTDYNSIANKYLDAALDNMNKGKDANSALRESNESANKEIAAAVAAAK